MGKLAFLRRQFTIALLPVLASLGSDRRLLVLSLLSNRVLKLASFVGAKAMSSPMLASLNLLKLLRTLLVFRVAERALLMRTVTIQPMVARNQLILRCGQILEKAVNVLLGAVDQNLNRIKSLETGPLLEFLDLRDDSLNCLDAIFPRLQIRVRMRADFVAAACARLGEQLLVPILLARVHDGDKPRQKRLGLGQVSQNSFDLREQLVNGLLLQLLGQDDNGLFSDWLSLWFSQLLGQIKDLTESLSERAQIGGIFVNGSCHVGPRNLQGLGLSQLSIQRSKS